MDCDWSIYASANVGLSVLVSTSGHQTGGYRHALCMYARVCVKQIAKHEFHPFTIASSPEEADLKFYIKCVAWGVESTLAVVGTGGPVKRIDTIGDQTFASFSSIFLKKIAQRIAFGAV
eukprot:5816165-Pyramimonas_sp.AAC.1